MLTELVAQIGAQGVPPYKWMVAEATAEDMAAAHREAMGGDTFDRLGLKRAVWEAWMSGSARLLCKVLYHTRSKRELARVTCFLPAGVKEPDWGLWARVCAWFGPAAGAPRPWKVIWFAATTPRRFPFVGQDLGPEHVNGGYTRPCSTEGIFIYRAEEATRVLIHEMMHAACLDEQPGTPGVHISRAKGSRSPAARGMGWSIPLREAQVEVWAELILIALLSRGQPKLALRLWELQSQWVANTNMKARADHGTHDISNYAWRYLCGREVMYARLGAALPPGHPTHASTMRSVRFTHPALGI